MTTATIHNVFETKDTVADEESFPAVFCFSVWITGGLGLWAMILLPFLA